MRPIILDHVARSVAGMSPAKMVDRSRCRFVEDLGGPKEACIGWNAHWRHLASTIEPSMCGGDAASYQSTLTSCLEVVHTVVDITRSTGTGHTSAKARLKSVTIRIRVLWYWSGSPPKLNHLFTGHCQPSLKILCKSVWKFLHKVPNGQTNNDNYISSLVEVSNASSIDASYKPTENTAWRT